MKQLLDQELPAAKPARQPYAKYAAGLLAIVSAGLLAYGLWGSHLTGQRLPSVAAFAIPTLPSESTSGLTSDLFVDPLPRSQASVSAASVPNASSTAALGRHSSAKSSTAVLPKSAASSAQSNTEPARLPAVERAASQTVAEPATHSASGTPVAALAKRSIAPLSTGSVYTAPKLPGEKKKTFTYGIEADIGSAHFQEAQSWSAAVFTQFPLAKWHARISAGYQETWQARTVAEQSFLFSNTRFSGSQGPIILQSSVELRQLSYVYLLPQIGYSVHPRLSVEGGLQYARLIGSRSVTHWSLPPNSQTAGPADSEKEELLGGVPESLASDQPAVPLRPYQLALQLGLRYRLNQHFSVSARWQQGLSNIYRGDSRTAYNRFGYLGLAYQLR